MSNFAYIEECEEVVSVDVRHPVLSVLDVYNNPHNKVRPGRSSTEFTPARHT